MDATVDGDRRVALVTGANRGIGRAVCGRLARAGLTVLVAARDPRRAEEAAAHLTAELESEQRGAGPAPRRADVRPVRLDVTDPDVVAAAARHVRDTAGRLDVLVNNAGISGGAAALPPGAASLDAVREVFETNVLGVLRVTDALLPLLRRSPAGRIVNVSSGVGSLTRMSDPGDYFAALPASAGYAPSKTALNAVTVQYAKALRGTPVLVNAADPGPCDTDFTRPLGLHVPRTADDGAAVVVRLALLPPDGPTGGYFDESGPVPW